MPRQQEHYCAKLVSEALGGTEYIENYRFNFLRGDPTPRRPQGVTLPVDAYYTACKIVLEFREGQHYGDRFDFRDSRITATGEPRKEQRARYDKRREEILPKRGIKILIIYDYQLTNEHESDLKFIRKALGDLYLANNGIYNRP